MSHVIPLHIFQTLKSDRWNCNVCGPSQKMTELNYVQLLLGRLPPSLSVLSTDHANRDQEWLQRTPSPRTVATITRTCRARRTPAPTDPLLSRSRRFGPPCCLARGGLRVRSAMWLCTDQSCPPVTNVARNSPPHISDFEIGPLELQRLWAISKNDRVKLRATFAGTVTAVTLGPLYRPREPRPRVATTNSFTKNRRNHH